MKVDKSLQEVWDWKEKVYQETKHLSLKDTVESIRKGAEDFCKKYKLRLRILRPA